MPTAPRRQSHPKPDPMLLETIAHPAIDIDLLYASADNLTRQPIYQHSVALLHPRQGPMHSRGVAIDLTLADDTGAPLDMGTGFDDMTARSSHGRTDVPPLA